MRTPHAVAPAHALLILVVCVGCGGRQSGESPGITTLSLEEVPPELMKVAHEQLPGVEFDTAWRKASGTYEIRGKARNGKIREVDLRPDGTVEEVE